MVLCLGLIGVGLADKVNRGIVALESLKTHLGEVKADVQKIGDIAKEPTSAPK